VHFGPGAIPERLEFSPGGAVHEKDCGALRELPAQERETPRWKRQGAFPDEVAAVLPAGAVLVEYYSQATHGRRIISRGYRNRSIAWFLAHQLLHLLRFHSPNFAWEPHTRTSRPAASLRARWPI